MLLRLFTHGVADIKRGSHVSANAVTMQCARNGGNWQTSIIGQQGSTVRFRRDEGGYHFWMFAHQESEVFCFANRVSLHPVRPFDFTDPQGPVFGSAKVHDVYLPLVFPSCIAKLFERRGMLPLRKDRRFSEVANFIGFDHCHRIEKRSAHGRVIQKDFKVALTLQRAAVFVDGRELDDEKRALKIVDVLLDRGLG